MCSNCDVCDTSYQTWSVFVYWDSLFIMFFLFSYIYAVINSCLAENSYHGYAIPRLAIWKNGLTIEETKLLYHHIQNKWQLDRLLFTLEQYN